MKVYLIPNVIAEDTEEVELSPRIRQALDTINVFFVENIRTARRYVSKATKLSGGANRQIDQIIFEVVDKTSTIQTVGKLFQEYHDEDIGVISESGCPGIADPGSVIAQYAHLHQIPVVPLSGPSSILLALMASGLNGQHFTFHGYLPIDKRELEQSIQKIELAARMGSTQIFIETPYRNQKLVDALLQSCHADTNLCIAVDVSGRNESITAQSIKNWRAHPPAMKKVPTVFLIN